VPEQVTPQSAACEMNQLCRSCLKGNGAYLSPMTLRSLA
jgi:hypothetical protein